MSAPSFSASLPLRLLRFGPSYDLIQNDKLARLFAAIVLVGESDYIVVTATSSLSQVVILLQQLEKTVQAWIQTARQFIKLTSSS